MQFNGPRKLGLRQRAGYAHVRIDIASRAIDIRDQCRQHPNLVGASLQLGLQRHVRQSFGGFAIEARRCAKRSLITRAEFQISSDLFGCCVQYSFPRADLESLDFSQQWFVRHSGFIDVNASLRGPRLGRFRRRIQMQSPSAREVRIVFIIGVEGSQWHVIAVSLYAPFSFLAPRTLHTQGFFRK